jgi:hypothetical protein
MPQRDGSAVHSLARERLLELESLIVSERQNQEEVVRVAMGSIYHGESIIFMNQVLVTNNVSLQPVQTLCVFFR